MSQYQQIAQDLRANSRTWLITGVAGFIGSNLLETLLKLDQRVLGLDNFATGHAYNLSEVQRLVSPEQWARFCFLEGDICSLEDCRAAMFWQQPTDTQSSHRGGIATSNERYPVDYVLHQAALGSVPRSIADPLITNASNVNGFLNMLVAARDAGIKNFVYAASSSTYGDHPGLPKVEHLIGKPLSPYAVTKYVNELYADVFARCYGFNSVGLRYFNVFGKRQDPNGAYAAVIPKWIAAMIGNQTVFVNGDGSTSRDFCHIENTVQANLIAATTTQTAALNQVYNIAVSGRTTLKELFVALRTSLGKYDILYTKDPIYRDFLPGDVRHSQADITKAETLLGYVPSHNLLQGIEAAMPWYLNFLK